MSRQGAREQTRHLFYLSSALGDELQAEVPYASRDPLLQPGTRLLCFGSKDCIPASDICYYGRRRPLIP